MAIEEIGRRVFAIRLALGDGWKNPMSQTDFGALLTKRAGRTFDSAMVSRMENGDRTVSIEEAVFIAALDPKKRGFTWLAIGDEEPAPAFEGPPFSTDVPGKEPLQTFLDRENAKREAANEAAAQSAGGRRKRGNGGR